MSYFDDIYDHAIDHHYLVTTSEAHGIGVPVVELGKLASRGRLERLGNGVYRLARYVPSSSDPYAVAVARVGDGAFLWGESVIEMLGLAPTTPGKIWVATTRRVRKALPASVKLINVELPTRLDTYDGIPGQRVADAIRACRETIMPKRLEAAARQGYELGYITPREMKELVKEFGWQ